MVMNTFDEIMKYCPFLKEIIENKITEEVEKAKEEKDLEITKLKQAIDNLSVSVLMGGE